MSKAEAFSTNYTHIKANEKLPGSKPVDYIFLSFDRKLTGEECDELAVFCKAVGSDDFLEDRTAQSAKMRGCG